MNTIMENCHHDFSHKGRERQHSFCPGFTFSLSLNFSLSETLPLLIFLHIWSLEPTYKKISYFEATMLERPCGENTWTERKMLRSPSCSSLKLCENFRSRHQACEWGAVRGFQPSIHPSCCQVEQRWAPCWALPTFQIHSKINVVVLSH